MVTTIDNLFGQSPWWLTTVVRDAGGATARQTAKVCVVGCGRWLHGDDQIGLLIAQELESSGLADTRVALTQSPAADLIEFLDDVSWLILVDAARPDEAHPPGSWARIDYVREPHRLHTLRCRDTHAMGVSMALQIIRGLGRMPPKVTIYAIAAGSCRPGAAVSQEVERAGRIVKRRITAEVHRYHHGEKGDRHA